MGRTNTGTEAQFRGSHCSLEPLKCCREVRISSSAGPTENRVKWAQAETGAIQIKDFHCWCGKAAQGSAGVLEAHNILYCIIGFWLESPSPELLQRCRSRGWVLCLSAYRDRPIAKALMTS